MKKYLFSIILGLLFFTNCTLKTTVRGLPNEAFLEFVGKPNYYSNGLDVFIDDKNAFKAKIHKDKNDRSKGSVYAISTGRHILAVAYNDQIIFKKEIFIASQETKKIVLP